jgi:hypothetical protein
MDITSKEETYETDDIYLAAYFAVCGCKLERRRKQGQKVWFVFSNPAGSMIDLRMAYYSNQGVVKARDFAQRVVDMKQLCHE